MIVPKMIPSEIAASVSFSNQPAMLDIRVKKRSALSGYGFTLQHCFVKSG